VLLATLVNRAGTRIMLSLAARAAIVAASLAKSPTDAKAALRFQ
jgi:hypothetical protein